MKRVATPRKPDVTIPVVVVAVDIHLALIAVPVEIRVAMYRKSSRPPPFEIFNNSGLNFTPHQNARIFCTKYLHFLAYIHHSI